MLFVPILAQIATLAVGDRTEARYVNGVDQRYEAATGIISALNLRWRHFSSILAYAPSITVTPLEREPRDVLVFHNLSLAGTYRSGHTSITLGETVGFGNENFAVQTLAGATPAVVTNPNPTTTGSAPSTGTGAGPVTTGTTSSPNVGVTGVQAANQFRAYNQVVLYESFRTSAGVAHDVSPALQVSANADYSLSGAARTRDRLEYPIVSGERLALSLRERIDPHDDLTSTVSVNYSVTSQPEQSVPQPGTSAWILIAGESWGHRLDAHTATLVGAGVAGTRSPVNDGFVEYSIYPTVNASITNSALRLARGTLTFSASASSAPVLDLVTGTVDPRLGVGAGVGWGRGPFSASASASGALSLAKQESRGGFEAAGGAVGAAYRFGPAFSLDSGLRAAWQSFQGQAVVPFSYAVFIGVSIGAQVPLNH